MILSDFFSLDDLSYKEVFKLSSEVRYDLFLKRVLLSETVWGLYDKGWALVQDEKGQEFFPLWPSLEYASFCRRGEWRTFEAFPIFICDLERDYLQELEHKGIDFCIFCTPRVIGLSVRAGLLIKSLSDQLGEGRGGIVSGSSFCDSKDFCLGELYG